MGETVERMRGAAEAAPDVLVVRRLLSATPEAVFDAWTTPESLRRWITPGGGGARVELDPRPGGALRIDMLGEGENAGKVWVHTGEFLEVDRPRRLVFTWSSEATEQRPSTVTIELTPRGAKTEIVLTHIGLPARSVDNHRQGWTAIVEQLDAALG